MATSTVTHTNGNPEAPGATPVPEPATEEMPRRGPGRPPGSKNRKNNKPQEDPEPPLAAAGAGDLDDELELTHEWNRKNMDFWEWLSSFSQSEWAHLIAYVYRTAPSIDRRAVGKHLYITKYVEPFDLDTLKRHHGSGGYRIDVNRTQTNGPMFRIAREYVNVFDVDFPPRVPPGEWMDAPENNAWQWAKEALQAGQAERAANSSGESSNLKAVLEHVERTLERNRTQDNGTGNSSLLIEMMRSQSKLYETIMDRSAKPAGTDPMVVMLLEDRKQMSAQINELNSRLLDLATAPRQEKHLIEQLGELVPAAEKVIKLVKPAAGNSDDRWADVVGKVTDHFPEILAAWRSSRTEPQQRQNGGFQMRQKVQHPPPPGASAAPESSAPDAQQTAHTAAEAASPSSGISPERQKVYEALQQRYGELLQSIVPYLLDHFRRGLSGYEFRNWFIDRKGSDNYALFRDDVDADLLTELAQQNDVLRVALRPPEKLRAFLVEFFTPEDEEPAIEPLQETGEES